MEIADEWAGMDLGDRRLNERAVALIEALSRQPMASINAACGGLAETTAAYRFFDNEKVTPEKLLEPHLDATIERMMGQPVVLLVQDTTEMDFSKHPPEGSGPLRSLKTRGYLDHTTLTVTPERLALGVVEVQMIARTDEGFGQSKARQNDPFETKEIARWLHSYRSAARLPERDTQAAGDTWIKLQDRLAEGAVRTTRTVDCRAPPNAPPAQPSSKCGPPRSH